MVRLIGNRCRDTRECDYAIVVILGLESGGSSNHNRDGLLVRQQRYRVLTRLIPRGGIFGLPEVENGNFIHVHFFFVNSAIDLFNSDVIRLFFQY